MDPSPLRVQTVNLPNLAYVGDVPLESSYHGSSLLYRLLERFPAHKLVAIETGSYASSASRRLTGVAYHILTLPARRMAHSRFHRFVNDACALRARRRASQVEKLLDEFPAEAVLSVGHGLGWWTAAEYARRKRLPLHLIMHDDVLSTIAVHAPVRRMLEDEFRKVYTFAASRFSVSPTMAAEYEQRYGVTANVLYPGRAHDVRAFDAPPLRNVDRHRPLTFGFGGTINSRGYVHALQDLARCLSLVGGQLKIFGPLDRAQAAASGLEMEAISLCGPIATNQFVQELRDEVDVLFVPLSFDQEDAVNMRLCFPSKLADYTATGIPILIYGPSYSSAVRWVTDNPGTAHVVTRRDASMLQKAVTELSVSAPLRKSLARAASVAGERYFSYESTWGLLSSALQDRERLAPGGVSR